MRIYLVENENRMRDYLKAAAPHLYEESDGWNAAIFNDQLMHDKVVPALKSFASR